VKLSKTNKITAPAKAVQPVPTAEPTHAKPIEAVVGPTAAAKVWHKKSAVVLLRGALVRAHRVLAKAVIGFANDEELVTSLKHSVLAITAALARAEALPADFKPARSTVARVSRDLMVGSKVKISAKRLALYAGLPGIDGELIVEMALNGGKRILVKLPAGMRMPLPRAHLTRVEAVAE